MSLFSLRVHGALWPRTRRRRRRRGSIAIGGGGGGGGKRRRPCSAVGVGQRTMTGGGAAPALTIRTRGEATVGDGGALGAEPGARTCVASGSSLDASGRTL